MILYAEHSFNASTFTARVVTCDARRPLLGGRRARSARSRARCTAAPTRPSCTSSTRSARPTAAEAWLDDGARREAQDHGLRAPGLQERRLAGADHEGGARHARSPSTTPHDLPRSTTRSRRRWIERKGIKPNLDYPSGPAYHLIGFDTEIFTPLFVAVAGHRLDRARHRAARGQRADPPAVGVRRPRRAPRAAGLSVRHPPGAARAKNGTFRTCRESWRSPPRCPSSRTPRPRSRPSCSELITSDRASARPCSRGSMPRAASAPAHRAAARAVPRPRRLRRRQRHLDPRGHRARRARRRRRAGDGRARGRPTSTTCSSPR